MEPSPRTDVLCIGAGILGLATARALLRSYKCSVRVVEAEPRPAVHQTGHNSGVIHSGLYYKPGSLKAHNCYHGRKRLIRFCEDRGVPHEICGKLVIATAEHEVERLDELERRGRANGLAGLERLHPNEFSRYEPHATGVDALWVPETGIVDYRAVCAELLADIQEAGGEVTLGTRVTRIVPRGQELVVETTRGDFVASNLVNCGGLQSDRVARLAGARPGLRIVPFRGDYFEIAESKKHLLKTLIYPVPDPQLPFLGVHLTRRIDGSVEAGPNAVLAFERDRYSRFAFSLRDTVSSVTFPGFWKMAAKFWKVGLEEMLRAGSRRRFTRDLQKFVPELEEDDLTTGGCGIRAQALEPSGKLCDDFAFEQTERALHVLNAPSPGATASLEIGDSLASRAADSFDLTARPADASSV